MIIFLIVKLKNLTVRGMKIFVNDVELFSIIYNEI